MMKTARQYAERVPTGLWFIVLAFLAYWPCLNGEAFWDDESLIRDNPLVASPQGLINIWTKPEGVPEYYPLTHTTYWIERHTLGFQPLFTHSVNVLLFGLMGWAMWRLFEKLRFRGAIWAAGLFIVHPIHVEAVAWMSQRKTVMSGLFYVLAALAFYKFKDGEGRRHYLWALALFALALLSKTAVLGLPLVFLIVNWWREKRWDWTWLREVAPFVLLSTASALLTLKMEFASPATPDIAARTLVDKLDLAGTIPFLYTGRFLYPFNLNLTYPDPPFLWMASLAALIALGVGLLILRRKIGGGPFAIWAYVLVSLAPILGLTFFPYMAFSFTADRFQFLADMGLVVGLVAVVRSAWILRVLGLVWLASTMYFSSLYRSQEELWKVILSRDAKSWVALEALAGMARSRSNEEAQDLYRRSWEASRRASYSGNEVGLDLIAKGRVEEGRAQLKKVAELVPRDPLAYSNLGISYLDENKEKEALVWLEKGMAVDPKFTVIKMNLAEIYASSKDTSVRNPSKALRLALEVNQNKLLQSEITLMCLGSVYEAAGRPKEARQTYQQALELAIKAENLAVEARIRLRLQALASKG